MQHHPNSNQTSPSAAAIHAPTRAPAPAPAHAPTPSAGPQTFAELKISTGTLDAIAAMGYETPSPIQGQAIPPFLQGRDILAQARTGTGKTAAFGIPIAEAARNLPDPGRNGAIVALVLVPTRELALQVTEELAQIAKGSRIRVIPIYGGVGMGKQNDDLRRGGNQVVVATPGRLLDHMQQGTIRLDRVRQLILDEADRMLDMGFLPDVERILRAVPQQRQTGLFSATVPEPIRRLSSKFLNDPVTVKVEAGPTATPLAEQFKIFMEKPHKTRALLALLAKEKPEQVIIFTRTKHLAKRLAPQLERSGHKAAALQGNMSQGQRERAMSAFREGTVTVLVATDIASRGIDVPEVSHVVNFDLPDEPEAYVHRIGRTGRMGRTGKAFTFVQSDEHRDLRTIESISGIRMTEYDVGELPPEPQMPPKAENGFRDNGYSRHSGGQARPRGPSGGFGRTGGRSAGRSGGGRAPPRRSGARGSTSGHGGGYGGHGSNGGRSSSNGPRGSGVWS